MNWRRITTAVGIGLIVSLVGVGVVSVVMRDAIQHRNELAWGAQSRQSTQITLARESIQRNSPAPQDQPASSMRGVTDASIPALPGGAGAAPLVLHSDPDDPFDLPAGAAPSASDSFALLGPTSGGGSIAPPTVLPENVTVIIERDTTQPVLSLRQSGTPKEDCIRLILPLSSVPYCMPGDWLTLSIRRQGPQSPPTAGPGAPTAPMIGGIGSMAPAEPDLLIRVNLLAIEDATLPSNIPGPSTRLVSLLFSNTTIRLQPEENAPPAFGASMAMAPGALPAGSSAPFPVQRAQDLGVTVNILTPAAVQKMRQLQEIAVQFQPLEALQIELASLLHKNWWFEIVQDVENQTLLVRGLPHELKLFTTVAKFLDRHAGSSETELERDPWFTDVLAPFQAGVTDARTDVLPWATVQVPTQLRSPHTLVRILGLDAEGKGVRILAGVDRSVVILRGPAAELSTLMQEIQALDRSARVASRAPAEETPAAEEAAATPPANTAVTAPSPHAEEAQASEPANLPLVQGIAPGASGAGVPPDAVVKTAPPPRGRWSVKVISHAQSLPPENQDMLRIDLPATGIPELQAGDMISIQLEAQQEISPNTFDTHSNDFRLWMVTAPIQTQTNAKSGTEARLSLLLTDKNSGANIYNCRTLAGAIPQIDANMITPLEVEQFLKTSLFTIRHQKALLTHLPGLHAKLYTHSNWFRMSVDLQRQGILVRGFQSEIDDLRHLLELLDQPAPLAAAQFPKPMARAEAPSAERPEPWHVYVTPVKFRNVTQLLQILEEVLGSKNDLRLASNSDLSVLIARGPANPPAFDALLKLVADLDQAPSRPAIPADQQGPAVAQLLAIPVPALVPAQPDTPWENATIPVPFNDILEVLQQPELFGQSIAQQQIQVRLTEPAPAKSPSVLGGGPHYPQEPTPMPQLAISGSRTNVKIVLHFLEQVVQQAGGPFPDGTGVCAKFGTQPTAPGQDSSMRIVVYELGNRLVPEMTQVSPPSLTVNLTPQAQPGSDLFVPDVSPVGTGIQPATLPLPENPAPTASKREILLAEFAKADALSRDVAAAYQVAENEPEKRAALEAQLRKVLAQAFELRQQAHALELAELRSRVEQAGQKLQARTQRKTEVLARRLQQLLQTPPSEWDPPMLLEANKRVAPTNLPTAPAEQPPVPPLPMPFFEEQVPPQVPMSTPPTPDPSAPSAQPPVVPPEVSPPAKDEPAPPSTSENPSPAEPVPAEPAPVVEPVPENPAPAEPVEPKTLHLKERRQRVFLVGLFQGFESFFGVGFIESRELNQAYIDRPGLPIRLLEQNERQTHRNDAIRPTVIACGAANTDRLIRAEGC